MIELSQSGDEWVLFVSPDAAKNRADAFENYDPSIPEWDQDNKGPFGDTYFPTLREAVEFLGTCVGDLREDI